MFRSLFILLFCFTATFLAAQDFEGIVEFKMQNDSSSQSTVWYIKDNMVRVDEFMPGTRMLKGCYLINVKDSTMQYLNHTAKTFGRGEKKMYTCRAGGTIANTKNSKDILTYKTTETVITYTDGTTISYWLSENRFGFFKTAAYILGGGDDMIDCYLTIELKPGVMPLLATWTNPQGKVIRKTEAVRIEKRILDAALFNVPADYKPE